MAVQTPEIQQVVETGNLKEFLAALFGAKDRVSRGGTIYKRQEPPRNGSIDCRLISRFLPTRRINTPIYVVTDRSEIHKLEWRPSAERPHSNVLVEQKFDLENGKSKGPPSIRRSKEQKEQFVILGVKAVYTPEIEAKPVSIRNTALGGNKALAAT